MEKSEYLIRNQITIDSFLLKRDVLIKELEGLEENWSRFFYNIKDLPLIELQRYLKNDHFYLEGAIRMWTGDEHILGFREWDLIDQLWSYFLLSFCKLISEKANHAEFYFPDQPLRVELNKVYEGQLMMKVGNKTHSVTMLPFISVCVNEAEQFFLKLHAATGADKYREEFQMIKALNSYLLQKE